MLRVDTAPTMPHMGDFLWTGHRASRRSADVMKTISKFHHLMWCLYEIYQQTQTNLNFSIRIASHMKPDDTDWELLATLQRDASPSNQALAEQVRISPPTALRRVRRLHEEGLIERQVALLDEDRIAALQGHGLTAIVEVTLERQGAEHLEAFERRAAGKAHVAVRRVADRKAAGQIGHDEDAAGIIEREAGGLGVVRGGGAVGLGGERPERGDVDHSVFPKRCSRCMGRAPAFSAWRRLAALASAIQVPPAVS